MFLNLGQGLSVRGHIVQERLAIPPRSPVEETFEGPRHLNLIIILEGLVELLQDGLKSLFIFGSSVHHVLDLPPCCPGQARHQVDAGLFALLLYVQLLLV